MKREATREQKERGTADFPLELYTITQFHPRYQMPGHWHLEWELVKVERGTLTLYLDRVRYDLHPGDICFVDGGVLHGGRAYESRYLCLVFDPAFIRHRGYRDDLFIRKVLHHKVTLSPVIRAEEYRGDRLFSWVVDSLFSLSSAVEVSAALKLFFERYEREKRYSQSEFSRTHTRVQIEGMKRVLEYIDGNYEKKISLDELAGQAGLNTRYFCTFFKAMTGRNCLDYINLVKMEKAAAMMQTGEMRVGEIAWSVGFSDSGYFSRLFRRYMGLTPSEYRSLHRER